MAGNDSEQRGREQETHGQPAWSSLLRETVKDIVNSIGESSRQLAASAERFAGDSLHMLEEFAGRSEHAAGTSRQMAAEAARAAEEARAAAERARGEGERLLADARRSFAEALQQANALVEQGRQLRDELQQRAQEALREISTSLQAVLEAAAEARRAAEEAARTASEARRMLAESEEKEAERAESLARRLEEEHARLAELLQELRTRAQYSEPAAAAVSPREQELGGRLILRLAPIPDVDRVLALDDALRRLDSVASVTLVDYVDETASFRLELQEPVSSGRFSEEFERSAGIGARVEAASQGHLSLRLS